MDRDIADLKFTEIDTAKFEEAFSGSRGRQIPGELMLMMGLLRWAIFEADLEWINDDSDPDYLFSFRSVCESLGMDCEAARKILNQQIGKGLRVFLPRPRTALDLEVEDVPGKTYSHGYGECPPGVKCSRCPECRQRYNHSYGEFWRRTSGSRNPIAARLSDYNAARLP